MIHIKFSSIQINLHGIVILWLNDVITLFIFIWIFKIFKFYIFIKYNYIIINFRIFNLFIMLKHVNILVKLKKLI
jgi:hypothetical protein